MASQTTRVGINATTSLHVHKKYSFPPHTQPPPSSAPLLHPQPSSSALSLPSSLAPIPPATVSLLTPFFVPFPSLTSTFLSPFLPSQPPLSFGPSLQSLSFPLQPDLLLSSPSPSYNLDTHLLPISISTLFSPFSAYCNCPIPILSPFLPLPCLLSCHSQHISSHTHTHPISLPFPSYLFAPIPTLS